MTPEYKQQMGEMAERWYGYGRWEAPFWFLGPEPGGDSPDGPLEAWCKLGKGELLDCREHHLAFGFTDWHNRGRLQPTWAKLMLLLQSFKAQDCSAETRKRYQTEMWGSNSGETCVIELCAVAASSLGLGSFDNSVFRERRIAQIRDRIQSHRPKFIVLYSRSHLPYWKQIVDAPFDDEGVSHVGDTVALTTPHPVAFGSTNAEWIGYGKMLRVIATRNGA